MVEISATDWNTNAISTRLSRSRSLSGSFVISRPSSRNMTSPDVGRSSAPRIFIRVVLPEPERPRSTDSRLGGICRFIPFSACTMLPSPIAKSMQTFRASIMLFISTSHVRGILTECTRFHNTAIIYTVLIISNLTANVNNPRLFLVKLYKLRFTTFLRANF